MATIIATACFSCVHASRSSIQSFGHLSSYKFLHEGSEELRGASEQLSVVIGLNVRHDGPQPSIFVRSFRSFTTTHNSWTNDLDIRKKDLIFFRFSNV